MNVERFIPIVKANLTLLDQGYSTEEVGRILMLSYGDVKTKASGLVSEDLVFYHEDTNQYFRKGKFTEEHFITRTNTCRQICNAYLEGKLTDNLLYSLLDKGRMVHYTTEEDNIKLRPFQQDLENYPTWEEQYAAANVKLVADPGMFGNTKYYYKINNTVYKNIDEAAQAIGVTGKTIKARSKNKKFPEYQELFYEI